MSRFQEHLRRNFLAGLFTGVPIGITVFLIWRFDAITREISISLFKRDVPFAGVLIALLGIYLSGLMATSLVGRFFLRLLDSLLTRVPVLSQIYTAWKQVAFVTTGTEGTFSRVALIGDESGSFQLLAFSSGKPIEGDIDTFCFFVPAAPNPFSGSRLYFVHRDRIRWLDITVEEAFKLLLSNGNYVPAAVALATANPEKSAIVSTQ